MRHELGLEEGMHQTWIVGKAGRMIGRLTRL